MISEDTYRLTQLLLEYTMFTLDSLFSILQYSVRKPRRKYPTFEYINLHLRTVSTTFKTVIDRLINYERRRKELKVYSIDQAFLKIRKHPNRLIRIDTWGFRGLNTKNTMFLAIRDNINWELALRENGRLIQKVPKFTERRCICAAKSIGMNVVRHIPKKYWTMNVLEAAVEPYNLCFKDLRYITCLPYEYRTKTGKNIQRKLIKEMTKRQGNVPDQYRMDVRLRYLPRYAV